MIKKIKLAFSLVLSAQLLAHTFLTPVVARDNDGLAFQSRRVMWRDGHTWAAASLFYFLYLFYLCRLPGIIVNGMNLSHYVLRHMGIT